LNSSALKPEFQQRGQQQSLERTKVGFRRQSWKANSYPVPETALDCEENTQKG
jgi:hypothetical protein